jgi:4-amino-4-deoxy-L-arabinose transferase-like glycosyltransferase
MSPQVETIPPPSAPSPSTWSSDFGMLAAVAAATIVAQLLLGSRFGFHRDELATLDDARHLAWGYVAYPPITPFFGRLSLILFGTSLSGFRFFANVAEAVAVVLTGLMARELGGRRGAQLVAAAAAIPFCLAGGALMQYVSFDYLCWVLAAYFVVRLLQTEDQRWWLAIGASIGFGMLTKYTMGFFALGIVAGVLFTNTRRHLTSKWLWIGVGLSVLIFLPNLLWQAQHHFISLDFLKHIHERDVRIGRTRDFLPDQLKLTLLAAPLWIAGLYFYLISKQGQGFRMLGWMYIVPLLLFIVAKGRGYYLAAAYPMLYAAGSVWGEERLRSLSKIWAACLQVLVRAALIADIVMVGAIVLPPAPVNSPLWKFASERNGDLFEELGWPELVQTVAQVRDTLPAKDRAHMGVLAGNYGEAGAINLYGPAYGLPLAISGINSFYERGYGNPPPETLIVLGLSREFLDRTFTSCQVSGHTPNPYAIHNEETSDHPDIYVCRGLRQPWPDFWKTFRYYG